MLGMPTFDLTTERGKQDFQKWITFSIKNEINSYARQVLNLSLEGGSGGGGAPTGPAGGVLSGNYPNPSFAVDMATQSELDNHASDTTNIHGISDTANLVYQNTPYLDFDTVTPGATGVGQIAWNDTTGTLEFVLKGGNVPLSIGQENVTLVKHADNSGLTKGKVVYVAGSDGSNKTVRYARADAEATSSKTFGVMAETASGGNKAFVCTQGIVSDINTIGLTEGAAVYVSPTTAGELTTTKPSAPNHMVLVGFCVRSHAVNGVLYVSVVNGFELQELHNVSINVGTLANGDIIKYNSSTGVWENVAADDIPAHASTHGVSGSDPVTIAPSQVTGTAVITSDSRLSDARTPTVHASTHVPGGSDAIDLTKIIGIAASLPTLPNALYPAGALIGVGAAAPYLLYRSSGSTWQQVGGGGGAVTDDTAPSTPNDGDLWYDSTTGKTFIYYADGSSNQWVEVGANSQLAIPLHGSSHVRGGSDVIDGDRLTVDYVPTNYTRNAAASGAGDNTDLTAHLSGINNGAFYKTSNISSGEANTININTLPWNMPWGNVFKRVSSGSNLNVAVNTLTVFPSLTGSVTLRNDRLYHVLAHVNMYGPNGATNCTFYFYANGVGIQNTEFTPRAGIGNGCSFSRYWTPVTTGSYTMDVRGLFTGGGGNFLNDGGREGYFMINDVGPA